MRAWQKTDRPIVLAHRGGADEYPENSIQAFEAMRDKGFTYIETDVHATSDGQLVIMHDPLLDRTTNGTGLISSHTWNHIAQLTDQSGNRPMLLKEALDMFPDIDFNIDVKADSAAGPLISLLKDSTYLDRVLVASFSEKRLRHIRRAIPEAATSLGTSAVATLFLASKTRGERQRRLLERVPGPSQGAVCVQMPERFRGLTILNRSLLDLAHSRGLAVHIWTVNEVMDMNRILKLGVDGIITDVPTVAREVIDLHMKRRGPQETPERRP